MEKIDNVIKQVDVSSDSSDPHLSGPVGSESDMLIPEDHPAVATSAAVMDSTDHLQLNDSAAAIIPTDQPAVVPSVAEIIPNVQSDIVTSADPSSIVTSAAVTDPRDQQPSTPSADAQIASAESATSHLTKLQSPQLGDTSENATIRENLLHQSLKSNNETADLNLNQDRLLSDQQEDTKDHPSSGSVKSSLFVPRVVRRTSTSQKIDVSDATRQKRVNEPLECEVTEKRPRHEEQGFVISEKGDNGVKIISQNENKIIGPSLDSESDADANVNKDTLPRPDTSFVFDYTPYQITGAWDEFETTTEKNFLRGCKWSPDGAYLLTNSNDNVLRVFDFPEEIYSASQEQLCEMKPIKKMKEGGLIYDFCWHPDLDSNCFITTSRLTPTHMWDVATGKLKCSYRAFNQVDEVVAAHSLAFSPAGEKLYCGFNKTIRVFDTQRPGRDCTTRSTYVKQGQCGIISCIASSPTEYGLYAAGSYSRSIGLYQEPHGSMVCLFQGQQGGVTQIMFSPDGTKLYSGGRKDSELLCWDLRKPGNILFVAYRQVETNQRIYFDLDSTGRYLLSGNHNGTISVWDTLQTPCTDMPDSEPYIKPVLNYPAHTDAVNSLSIHPSMPIMCTGSGQRHFPLIDLGDSDDSDDAPDDAGNNATSKEEGKIDNSLRLWWFPQESEHAESS